MWLVSVNVTTMDVVHDLAELKLGSLTESQCSLTAVKLIK